MIKSLDKKGLQMLRQELQAAVDAVGLKHGIKILVGNARFTPDNATFKVEIATVAENGMVNDHAASDFKQSCGLFGLKPDHFGAEISYGRERYKIAGLTSGRSYKYPILAERVSDGKKFKLPIAAVSSLADKSAPFAEANHATGFSLSPLAPPLAPPTPEERKKVEAMIADLKNNNPEAYYADGERGEKEAHRACFNSFLREIRGIGLSALFASKGK